MLFTVTQLLPGKLVEGLLRSLQVDLNLLSFVEYRAVAVRANDVLVKGALATLALRPKLIKYMLVFRHARELVNVDLPLLTTTTGAQGTPRSRVLGRDEHLAAETLFGFNREHHNTTFLCSGCWFAYRARMIARQKRCRIRNDGLEYPC